MSRDREQRIRSAHLRKASGEWYHGCIDHRPEIIFTENDAFQNPDDTPDAPDQVTRIKLWFLSSRLNTSTMELRKLSSEDILRLYNNELAKIMEENRQQ